MVYHKSMHSKGTTDEARFANEQLEHFWVEAKRNMMLSEWVAEVIGIGQENAKVYFMNVIGTDLSKPGPAPVVAKVLNDLQEAGLDYTEQDVWDKLNHFEHEAYREVHQVAEKYRSRNNPDK